MTETKTSMSMVLRPQTFDQLVIFSEMAANSDLVPKDYRGKPGNIMIAVQMGSELGLAPMQAVNSIAIINGRPGVWGDGLIGLCRQSPLCQDIQEHFEGEGDQRTAVCVATRRGSAPVTATFSVADAKKAGLWSKPGPWQQYPDRMLQNRARGFALRDAFPDVLRGLKTGEELRDTPADTFQGTTLDARPEPAPTRRDEINREVPVDPPKDTVADKQARWLDRLQASLNEAVPLGVAAVDAICERPTVIAELKGATGAYRRAIDDMLSWSREAAMKEAEIGAANEPVDQELL
jgi:hypothetical protein